MHAVARCSRKSTKNVDTVTSTLCFQITSVALDVTILYPTDVRSVQPLRLLVIIPAVVTST